MIGIEIDGEKRLELDRLLHEFWTQERAGDTVSTSHSIGDSSIPGKLIYLGLHTAFPDFLRLRGFSEFRVLP